MIKNNGSQDNRKYMKLSIEVIRESIQEPCADINNVSSKLTQYKYIHLIKPTS